MVVVVQGLSDGVHIGSGYGMMNGGGSNRAMFLQCAQITSLI